MVKREEVKVNIITPGTNKVEIRSTKNASGQQVAVGEDVLVAILMVLGEMKGMLEELRDMMLEDEEDEEEED
jgi:hypothetical protein